MRLEKIASEALKHANDNRYLLSASVAKRVSQLQSGAKPLVEVAKFEKQVDIALREIAAGLIEIKSV
jgi:DNA-directed RNA polymerase omega subunit